jgi:type I restriction enzyme M protein
VIQLMVNLLLSDETDLAKSNVVKTIYDPTCGTGGMLSTAEHYLRSLNSKSQPAPLRAGLQRRVVGGVQERHAHQGRERRQHHPWRHLLKDDGHAGKQFDYMLANPPFGVEWKQQQKAVENE